MGSFPSTEGKDRAHNPPPIDGKAGAPARVKCWMGGVSPLG